MSSLIAAAIPTRRTFRGRQRRIASLAEIAAWTLPLLGRHIKTVE
jgi:hypothetical protein